MYIGLGALLVMVIAASLALARKQRFAIWVLVAGLVMFSLPFVIAYFQVWSGWQFTFPFYQLWYVGALVTVAGIIGVIARLIRRVAG